MTVNPVEPGILTQQDQPAPPVDDWTFWKRQIADWLFWGFWLTVSYALSIGPAYWLWHRAYYTGGEPFVTQLYFPLMLLSSASDFVANWLEWYISLWIL